MSKKALRLGLCLLVLAALCALPASASEAPISLSYTQSGVGGTMEQACNNAIQKIKDYCDVFGPITTDPGRCWPLYDIYGEFVGFACTCEATTSYCGKFIGFPT
jgi:hypothetical protein